MSVTETMGPDNTVWPRKEALDTAQVEQATSMSRHGYENYQNYLSGSRDMFHFHLELQDPVMGLAAKQFADFIHVDVLDGSLPVIATQPLPIDHVSTRWLEDEESVELAPSGPLVCEIVDVGQQGQRLVRAKIYTLGEGANKKQCITYYGCPMERLLSETVEFSDNYHG